MGFTQIISVDASNCTSIGDNAFLGCTELEWIRLPMNCEIGEDAFFGTALNTLSMAMLVVLRKPGQQIMEFNL